MIAARARVAIKRAARSGAMTWHTPGDAWRQYLSAVDLAYGTAALMRHAGALTSAMDSQTTACLAQARAS